MSKDKYLCNKEKITAEHKICWDSWEVNGSSSRVRVFSYVLHAFFALVLVAKNGQINQLSKLKPAINVK